MASSNKRSYGSSGAVTDDGAVGLGEDRTVPGTTANVDLDALLGDRFAATLLDLDLAIGAVGAEAEAQGEAASGDYTLAGMKLKLSSPAISALTDKVNAALDEVQLGLGTLDGSDGTLALDLNRILRGIDPALNLLGANANVTATVDAGDLHKLVQDLLEGKLALEWAPAQVVRDDPAKTLDMRGRTDVLLLSALLPAIGTPKSSFDLVSPYFVPGDGGTDALVDLASAGVRVRVLTNALAATDVAPVHAGYAKRRCTLLRAGVRLFELRPLASVEGIKPKAGLGSSSSVQLHAKTFAVDRARIFVGSFNFDQRSAHLNTEMGLVIDSPVLAKRLADALDADFAATTYEARVASDGRCPVWVERTPSGEIVHDVEPDTGAGQRALIELLQTLPIEWLL